MNIDARLREQNNGEGWADCNALGHAHRWEPEQVPNYWRCRRCPVDTRHEGPFLVGNRPPAYLPAFRGIHAKRAWEEKGLAR